MNNFNKSKEELYWISNYFEVELNFEENEKMEIGLLSSDNQAISLWPSWKLIYYYFQLKRKKIKLPSFTYKTNDIIGCGLVYPPLNMTNKLPYVFFTQNGKQIGKAILLKENYETFKPFVGLLCCSIDANFGDNYSKPFVYDIYKHYVTEEFYEKEEFSDD